MHLAKGACPTPRLWQYPLLIVAALASFKVSSSWGNRLRASLGKGTREQAVVRQLDVQSDRQQGS